jgi:hypothetical protein
MTDLERSSRVIFGLALYTTVPFGNSTGSASPGWSMVITMKPLFQLGCVDQLFMTTDLVCLLLPSHLVSDHIIKQQTYCTNDVPNMRNKVILIDIVVFRSTIICPIKTYTKVRAQICGRSYSLWRESLGYYYSQGSSRLPTRGKNDRHHFLKTEISRLTSKLLVLRY